MEELLAGIAARTAVRNLSATDYKQYRGYLQVDYVLTEQLALLQGEVVDAINPLRDGLREEDELRLLSATGPVRENLEKYGYRGVGALYQPHLTLARFADVAIRDTQALPELKAFSGRFTRLGLCEIAAHGTCVRKIMDRELA